MPTSLERLVDLLRHRRLALLTGAGISTESGIPDYRGPATRDKARPRIQYRPFVERPAMRARYWARSAVGWPRFRDFRPNPAHRAVAALQSSGTVVGVITQNVDRLHRKAGSEALELHGALAETRCLDCGRRGSRDALQDQLLALNPAFRPSDYPLAPDGDAEVPEAVVAAFVVPECPSCGGVIKPDVVFFGESVPPPRVAEAFALVDAAEALLIVGSSLAIHSGYRFLLRARQRRIPVGLINLGDCRGLAEVQAHVDGPAGVVLPALAAALGAKPGGQPSSAKLVTEG